MSRAGFEPAGETMHYLDYNEQIHHTTGDFPLAFYPVDMRHER